MSAVWGWLQNLEIDFQGQKRAETLYQYIMVLFGVVGVCWGFYCQQFIQTFYFLTAGFLLSCILVVPAWPMYRMHPLNWRKVKVI